MGLNSVVLVAVVFLLVATTVPIKAETGATLTVHVDSPGAVINKYVYGQFSEHLGSGVYGGVYVGADSPIPNTRGLRNDVVAALKELQVPLLRWPGGCFADEYHWRDGIGPQARRVTRVNTNWGGVPDPNTFGTHEFFDLVELIGADAYVNANMGTGTVAEAAQWLEYMTGDQDTTLVRERRANGRDKPFKVAVYAMGNETWGCGGNMRPEYYADQYNQWATFMKTSQQPAPLLLASGDRDGAATDFTEALLENRRARMDAISMHYYTVLGPRWENKDTATGFSEKGWITILANTLKMDGYIKTHDELMTAAEKRLGAEGSADADKIGLYIDEWGTWHQPEPGSNPGFLVQQNTIRDAIAAAANLNIFHKYADRVQMTSIAQTVNVLQAMVLTDGPKMLLTPTYHVFHMYKPFQGATSLPVGLRTGDYSYDGVSVPQVSASAAKTLGGEIVIGLANLDPHRMVEVTTIMEGMVATEVTGEILAADAMDAHNTFDAPDAVHPVAFDGARLADGRLSAHLPPKSVVVLKVK
ncbi:MAG: alpha-N-arabinofuranosidase [Acidobacteriota bacterium]|jgi:alpha-N-arabinofuranosidase|nr:alpha-N-arabinofuranosidase [Acidobacteriota bacterium]